MTAAVEVPSLLEISQWAAREYPDTWHALSTPEKAVVAIQIRRDGRGGGWHQIFVAAVGAALGGAR